MKKLRLFLMVIVASFAMTSCTGYSFNQLSNVNQNQTSVVLSQKNFHVVKKVSSSCTQTYLFGLGGMRNMTNNAIAELTEKAQLTGSQALVNIVAKETIAVKWFIIQTKSVYAEATVIEFDE